MNTDINFIQLLFGVLGIVTFVPGLITNYGDKYVPTIILRLFRYGRANVSKEGKNLDFIKKIEVPKNWFYHSYIFSVLFQSLIIYTVLTAYKDGNNKTWINYVLSIVGGSNRTTTVDATTTVLAISLYLVQVSRRLFETCFVCIYSNTKMNIAHYLLAWIHYIGSMFSIVAHSPGFSGSNSSSVADFRWSYQDFTILHLLATILFIYGSIAQYQAHVGFANLRKGKDNKVVSMEHQIPKEGLFELISCPNYWGEIVVYSSFSILFRFQNYTWNYIALWVIANQIIMGIMNHNWYKRTFPDYPKQRKAVIPYLW